MIHQQSVPSHQLESQPTKTVITQQKGEAHCQALACNESLGAAWQPVSWVDITYKAWQHLSYRKLWRGQKHQVTEPKWRCSSKVLASITSQKGVLLWRNSLLQGSFLVDIRESFCHTCFSLSIPWAWPKGLQMYHGVECLMNYGMKPWWNQPLSHG